MGFLNWWRENNHSYQAMLFDIDGTLIAGRHLLPGADQMLNWLRENDFPFYLLTNDGNHSLEEKSVLLGKAGLKVAPQEIVSCSSVIKLFVDQHNLHGSTAFVMGDLGKPDYAEGAGLKVIRDIGEIDDCRSIIVGEGTYDWQKNFTAVLNAFIADPSRHLVVPNPDSYWPNGPSGEIGIGAGGKARFIATILAEMDIEVKPHYLGKPYHDIYEYTFGLLKERFGMSDDVPPAKIIMLGDSLASDILGANKFGFDSGLMLTGITNRKQAEKAIGHLKPAHIFDAFKK
jgi:HAD superfamily hydrolase (TIGR01450 family)